MPTVPDDWGGRPLVTTEGVSVRFGDVTALDNVRFKIDPGDFLAVLGPNGSGKTTLFHCILGLTDYRGTIVNRAQRVGFVPQIKNFDRSFPGKAVEVVTSGVTDRWPGWRDRRHFPRARAALAWVGASDYAERQLAALSGGQLQRVYLARALVHEPDLLLLDEPAAGIDRAGEYDIYEYLEAYQRERPGVAIAMITHDWEVARHHADKSLILNHRVIGFGPSNQVLTEDCLRQAFGHMGHAHALGSNHG
ncbi:metal ABC transporter ATP-binding protein [Thiohalorhabdus sp.]|uniref:metal ABC transporter ATP-binding protein n=1 Tax=Thiohalorhabdus sp. TaxID=3094134 RepID=UPI002FC2F4DC